MEHSTEGNLLEIMDLARTLRQEKLFIQQEQAAFSQLTETLAENSTSITKLAYICAQQRQNLNDLIISRPETGPNICCRRANNYDNAKFIDSKKVMDYEHSLAYEELFNYLYGSPYLLAFSLATGDRLPAISQLHLNTVIHSITTGLYGNAINTKDVEMLLKLLRELIEIQIVVSDNPRRLLRANSSAFARLYHRLNESLFSAKIFLTAALYEPLMGVLRDSDTTLDVDPDKVLQSFSSKERLRRFGVETSDEYQKNIIKFHAETISKLHALSKSFIDSLTQNWSLFPSTLRWLVQTMCHQLKQAHFADKVINEIIADMVFTHFICPAIVSPDLMGIIDAPISEQVRFNLIQIGQIIQMLALTRHHGGVPGDVMVDVELNNGIDSKFAMVQSKFEANLVTNLIDLLLVGQSGEDVVAILSQQSDFERAHLLSTQHELSYFVEFFRILMTYDEYDISMEARQKLNKILAHIPAAESTITTANGSESTTNSNTKEHRSKQSLISLRRATKNKIAKSMSFSSNNNSGEAPLTSNSNSLTISAATTLGTSISTTTTTVTTATSICANGGVGSLTLNGGNHVDQTLSTVTATTASTTTNNSNSSIKVSPIRSAVLPTESQENEPILVFNIYSNDKSKLQPLTEEEVLKMNSIGQEMANGEVLLVDTADSCNLENTIDKSSVANGYDGIDGMSDCVSGMRPLHAKATRFSLSHDDASIGNSDNLEAVSEAPSNHSVTSSLELEEEGEHDENDNLSDMVSANVSGRGTPNISGRDTPSSQVTDGESVHNALPTPQMQKLLSKARSDIEDKFCKFEIKKFEGDENVSIISDTWSTDVLASDSETLDASERERDRNFSTPLIPSAVVLPGDNNFVDALTSVGGNVRGVGGYLDASDQRSESNWSTDVLVSDSEKLAEVDTDDNVSITAKSDITDAGARSEAERDLLAATISARGVRSYRSGTLTARNNDNNRASASGSVRDVEHENGNGSGGGGRAGSVGGDNASDRSQEDGAFFDAINMYDDAGAAASADGIEDCTGNPPSLLHYQGPSSLARSSVRTTNQYSGENSFQQNYKSGYNDDEGKATFLATPRMRRQTSAESSISNQSLNLDDTVGGKPPKPSHHHHKCAIKKKKHSTNNNCNLCGDNDAPTKAECRDLIDFSDCSEDKIAAAAATLRHRQQFVEFFGDNSDASGVEHRRISSEQRTAGFDGRRNGIMAMKNGSGAADGSGRTLPSSLRRHQSLNYENHEIMLNANIPKRLTMMPNSSYVHNHVSTSQTDDDKQQELLLCAKTDEMHLNDQDTNEVYNGNVSTIHKLAAVTAAVSTTVLATCSTLSSTTQKPTKLTGAIPKSISFDASADKNCSGDSISVTQRNLHDNNAFRHAAGVAGGISGGVGAHSAGIFNKLKQGIFKHRRGNKSHRHTATTGIDGVTSITSDDFLHSNRSVSFNQNASEVSLDFISDISVVGGDSRNSSTFCDISEDILAKYRRKVSTSSEATNSDSTGNGGGLLTTNRKDIDVETNRLSLNSSLHDKTFTFNIIKKKIRTVLSKTDLHSGDFRHTTYINASPLLTYLQIQLAQAINLQNFQQISYVSEAIRCIATLEPKQHAQLLEELQYDIQKRQNYLQYLMRFRQNLLLIMENTEQYEARLRGESSTCNRYLMNVCVRLFLEKRQTKIEAFQSEFARLTVSDDKIDLIEECINGLMDELQSSGGILHGMPEWQTQEARISIERILLQRMYQQVMFPNEDADLSRDSVLSEHICKLQRIIRPSHPALCIPQEYLSEAPWTFAQQQLSYISAYKTPREKLQCVIRCISSIMSLLHMSSGRIPAADDLLPVLIYVVIMANPPYLLSTVEYITCFIGEKLDGEAQFHWTLFGSVVKFIKTMDYLDKT